MNNRLWRKCDNTLMSVARMSEANAKKGYFIAIAAATIALSGCTQFSMAPVSNLFKPSKASVQPTANSTPAVVNSSNLPKVARSLPAAPIEIPLYYRVQSGDTLDDIAEEYGLSYKYLAKLNRIKPPYQIYVGQILRLQGNLPKPQKQATKVVKTKPVVKVVVKPKVVQKKVVPPKYNIAVKTKFYSGITWQNSSQGHVIQPYTNGNGVMISAAANTNLYAAANGKVIFAGKGLKGLGEMLIVSPKVGYLYVYSNLKSSLVTEGANIKRGQLVATASSKYGFELRLNGQTIDPNLIMS